MKDTSITLRFELPLKQKLAAAAKAERRTLEGQTLCLINNALRVFESKTLNQKGERRNEG